MKIKPARSKAASKAASRMSRMQRPPVAETYGQGLPSREAVLAFIEGSPDKVGKREIARHFGITGNDKIGLKRLIGELSEAGNVAGNRKYLSIPGHVPAVTTLDITGRDPDGDLIGEPAEWEHDTPRPRVIVLGARQMAGESAVGVGDRVLAKLTRRPPSTEQVIRTDDPTHEAVIIKKLVRDKRRLLGLYRKAASGYGGTIEPIDKKELRSWSVPKGQEGDANDGDLVRFEVARSGRIAATHARVMEALGNPSDQRQISLIAIHTHSIPDDFPASVIAESEAVIPPTLDGRTDLRALPFITIDPADARDHDDAVYAEPDHDTNNPDGFVLYVAIADVAQAVRPFTKLDREALLRGNSVYFPDRVVPMLPERISNDLCSLREGVDRSVIVARMVFDFDGDKRDHTFLRAMINSKAKLSYQEAQAAIDGQPTLKALTVLETVLRPLWNAYAKLAAARDRREPLDLDLPERKIILDKEGRVAQIHTPPRLAAHRLIEECMIQANVAAAEELHAKRGPVVYRVHDQPSKEKLKNLRDFLNTLDMKLPPEGSMKPGALNKVLAQAKTLPVPELVNEIVLRSQSQAEYNPENIGHFGLHLRKYAHFTSPIRRYADLLVHRALIRTLKLGTDGMDDAEIPKLAIVSQAISQAERRAMQAERETTDRLIASHLADRIGAVFDARIGGVTRSGLFVRLKESGADGFIPISTLGDEYFNHVEEAHAVVGSRSGTGYRMGDQVQVKLLEVVASAGAMRFQMVTPAQKLTLRVGRSGQDGYDGPRGPRRLPRRKPPRR
jgi:ribonuclease R